ncbi:hypothetical protein EMCRGX_G000657 [Ephydatia muelleri]
MTSKGKRYPYGGLQVKAELRPKSHEGAAVPGENSPCNLDVRRTNPTLCNPEQIINCSGGPSGIAIHDNGDICGQDHSIHVFD